LSQKFEEDPVWSNLPTQLRTVLGAALLLVIGVAVASFTLSFIALREVASNPAFGWGRNAWIFPACVDMALVASEVVLIGASMVRGVNRAVPFVLMVAFGALTVWFNVERVPSEWRIITATPPLAGIFMTLLVAYLVKILARVTGTAWEHAPPPPAYGMLGAPGSPLQGAVWRQDAAPYGMPDTWHPYGQMPSPPASTLGQNGHGEEVKRDRIRAYLSRLSGRPEALAIATGSSVVEGVQHEEGVTVSLREASRELDAVRGAQPKASRNGRRR
jgi:Protein of unknown function (DUF2637)